MALKKKVPEDKENLRPTVPSKPTDPGQMRSDIRELGVGRRSLRDAVLLLAKKIEGELGVDVSEVTEMLGVSDDSDSQKTRPVEPDIFERDTVDMTRPVSKAGGKKSDG